jgi:hypothetical protein
MEDQRHPMETEGRSTTPPAALMPGRRSERAANRPPEPGSKHVWNTQGFYEAGTLMGSAPSRAPSMPEAIFLAGAPAEGDRRHPSQGRSYVVLRAESETLVGREGFEPPTHGLKAHCSDQAELTPLF